MELENKSENGKSIPYDIMIEIFLRLPVKSLIRFKSVSKQWLFTISYNPDFIQNHLSRQLSYNYVQGITSNSITIKYPSYDIMKFESDHGGRVAEILSGSCNGLVLVGTGKNNHFLCNPSTRSYKRIPGDFQHVRNFVRMYGLCYDPNTEAYKVIRIVRATDSMFWEGRHDPFEQRAYDSTQVRVYNSRTNSWIKIKEFPYKVLSSQQGRLVNGSLHWIVGRDKVREYVIIYFDLVDDRFKELENPSCLVLNSDFRLRVSLQGFLCLDLRKGDVWVMNEYGNKDSWTKLNRSELRKYYCKGQFAEADYVESLVSPHIKYEVQDLK